MCRSFIFFISFVLLILFSVTSCERTSLSTADPKKPEACVTKLSMCELDAENHNFVGMKGEKGEIGFPGSIGPIGSRGQPGGTGSKGEKGVKGSPGKGGIQGPEGGIGPVGRAGNNGKNGRDGLKGDPGKPGSDGQPGLQGEMGPTGPQGEKGERGHKGDTGAPGIPGTCDCYNSKESTDDITDTTEKPPEPKIDENWGTELQPTKVTCKDAPSLPADRKFFFMNPGPMKVTCDKTKTCIQYSEMKNISYTEDSEPFWLSSKNVTLQDIYNLNIEQIYWLHNQSFSAYTTIRYHCLNSKPVNENSTLAMELLTWNDLVVGSKDTVLTPLHYTTLYDGCSDASNTAWNYTDITLVSTIAKRLPIIDFLIKDVKKNEIQKFRVEILNLCFG